MSGTKLKNSRYYITQNNIFLGKKTSSTSVEGSSSNIQKIKETEHEEEGASLQEFVFEQANKFFIDHIPIETIKDLPNTYLYFFGTVAHLLAMLLFIYFVYNNYSQAVSEAYISLTTDGGDCNTVPISITGTYLADYNGNWAGTPEYEESLALYQLSFSNFEISSELQYNEMMSNFYTNLVNIGDKAKTYNLAENLIYWMTYVDYYDIQNPSLTNFTEVGYGQLQTLQLTADPAIVFDLLHNIQRFSSKRGKCPVSSYTTYDQANHIFQSYYSNASKIFQNANCSYAVNPLTFGYYPTTDGYIYNVGLHMQAIAVALGVNFGIIPFQTLRVISRKVANFTYGRSSYTIGEYYDVRYPTMQTLFCIANATALPPSLSPYQQLCFLATGTTFILPVFNQYGIDITKPVYCDCSDPILKHNEVCSQFNLLTGMLFYHSKDEINLKDVTLKELIHQLRSNVTGVLTEFGLFNLLKLVQLYPSYRAFNRAAYNASFYTIADASHCDEECWREVYSFCRLPNSNLTCSLSIVGSETTLLNTVSDYKYQLQNGSCTASMVISESNWAKLVENPPVQFTQIYYECYQPTTSAFITAVGVASGNTQIFIPFFVFGLLPFLYFLLVAIRQVPPKEEYTKAERSDANEILSLLLLRIRDGKTRGIKKQGILQGLAKELIAAAKEEGGYPDSDDEDEEIRPDSSPVKHNNYDVTDKAKAARMILREDSLISVDENTPRDDVSMMRDTEQRQSHSHRRSQQRIRKIPKRNARFRMGVFTKQLKGKYVEEEEEEDHNHRASNASPRDTMGRETDVNASDVRETELTRKTTLLERSPTTLNGGTSRFESESQPPNHLASTATNRRKSSLLSYFFGGGESDDTSGKNNQTNNSNVLIPRIHGKRILDAETDVIPNDIQVLNHFDEDIYDLKKKLTQPELSILLDDLIRYLNEALSQAKYRSDSTSSSTNPLILQRDSVESGIVHLKGNRDIPAFLQAKELTKRLIRVNFDELYKAEDQEVYIKLSNILCMHASIELECEMKAIATLYAKRIAYNIGGKILTADDLNRILQQSP